MKNFSYFHRKEAQELNTEELRRKIEKSLFDTLKSDLEDYMNFCLREYFPRERGKLEETITEIIDIMEEKGWTWEEAKDKDEIYEMKKDFISSLMEEGLKKFWWP